jgi:hypothetical protein
LIKIINERIDHDRHTAPQPSEHRTGLALLGYRLGLLEQGATALGTLEQRMGHRVEGEPTRMSGVNPAQQRLEQTIRHFCAKPFVDITPDSYVMIKGGRRPFWL